VNDPADRRQAIIEDADRCVKCAVCLPHCPTYRVSGNEAESPRGRIALMRALADGSQEPGPGMVRHLDQCLACRSCEPVCPANVPYGRLLDNARAELALRRPPSLVKRAGLALLPRRRLLRGLWRLARVARALGAARLAPPLKRLPGHIRAARWRTEDSPSRVDGRRVGLFVGCVAETLDMETRQAAVRVLNACGHQVVMPAEQTCCGALHEHSGIAVSASELARRNRDAFQSASLETIVSTATGCGAHLGERVFQQGHRDICEWLAADKRLPDLVLEPLPANVVVQVPCTQRNVLQAPTVTRELVSRIPGIRIRTMPVDPKCCGAAGSYMLEHGGIADELGRIQAEAIARQNPDYVVTANVGCALHLADHLRRLGNKAEVLHPVTLLARQLR
jgi:glycolate oxidase iron-sulfur subunit